MSKLLDLINVQKEMNNEIKKKADGKDILFLLFCVFFPFFTYDIIINIFIFSLIGLGYFKFGIVNLFSNKNIVTNINS